MTSYIIRRLSMGVVVIFIVTVMVFLFIRLLPGDPLTIYLNKTDMQQLTEEQLFELRVKFGLEKPLPMQYVDWIGGLFKGDMGQSVYYNIDVRLLMTERLPVTLYLGALAFVISGVLGISFGVICALKRGTWVDTLVTLLANIGITMPSFWVGIILIYLLSVKAGWLPVSGFISPFENFWESTRRIIMPVTCLALFPVASLTRLTRSSMLEVIQQDYIRTAWSKGLKERLIVSRHTIKNALIPVITVVGLQVAFIFGGSVLIESVFNINGIGRLATQAVQNQDYLVVQAVTLVIAIMVVLSNLIVDISYGWLDPRIRYD
ncbi:MAG: peptide ABC transporter [Chloroflexi bacterium RBG_13_51_18]|nr:MAG: peptide ABC transporter [Chloroflexi bacterium RBG_13_51_18]